MFSRILVPYAGRASAQAAWECGLGLARRHDAELHLLGVVDMTIKRIGVEHEAERRYLLQALQKLSHLPVSDGLTIVEAVAQGDVCEQIVAHAQKVSADLIIMGRQRPPSTGHQRGGALNQRVIEQASCAVLVVH